jgi:hypothetical protein
MEDIVKGGWCCGGWCCAMAYGRSQHQSQMTSVPLCMQKLPPSVPCLQQQQYPL